jgi:hypothetical protein
MFGPRKIWQPCFLRFDTFMCRYVQTNEFSTLEQGRQMAYFQTKNIEFGPFFKALKWNVWVYFVAILVF